MVALRTLERTAVFAWSPGSTLPLIVTGTKVGALSDDFSGETKLELWDLEWESLEQDPSLKPVASITTDSAFNDLAWGEPDEEHPFGVIAGALENGSIDLWDAQKLRDGKGEAALISRTTKHSGAAKALQWNPYRQNLLASVGAKGEIFIYDLNNMSSPFRLGASAARADDLECLDWNKSEKTAHILATGSSGGFVTVWDVKQKKDILTLHNQGRKAVSAVAWDPEQSTKLATATSNDTNPVILIWSLRNANAAEATFKGHELGVLGLSWCRQDPLLLLSCGKDNRTICWNTKTGEKYGDFAAGSNWAFQTRWNPHNPSLIASASFDGKILITSTQSTNLKKEDATAANQALDGEDFFAKAQAQPQGISFSLPQAPKWASRPTNATFGFGGKLVVVSTDPASRKSKVKLETFMAEDSIGSAAEEFEKKLSSGEIDAICTSKIEEAKTEEQRADWKVIETLNFGASSRKKLREYLGFEDEAQGKEVNGEAATNGEKDEGDDFFAQTGSSEENFLSNLASTKGTKTNVPYSIYAGTESDADKSITRSLLLGNFESALDVCLAENRMSDAFMIAVCGGQKCIDKAQNAYLKSQKEQPNYLRLLASILGKNLWDVVNNADLADWKSVMATLCTFADENEFAELCEILGDRLEEAYLAASSETAKELRRDASFCYLAGSKLEKLVQNWIAEFSEQEKSMLAENEENDFTVHVKCLREFVEKVSVFRKVSRFTDGEMQKDGKEWKLAPLYALYAEYAEILAAHGRLDAAEEYVNLLPGKYGSAEAAQTRVKLALGKGAKQPAAVNAKAGARMVPAATMPGQGLVNQARNASMSAYAPVNAPAPAPVGMSPYAPGQPPAPAPNQYAPASNTYAPVGYQPPQPGAAPYGQPLQPTYAGGYQAPQQAQIPLPPPPRGNTSSPAIPPPSAAKNMSNWNDMPDNFFKDKPNSRRGTPGPNAQPVTAPFPNAVPAAGSPIAQRNVAAPLPPPPKPGEVMPQMASPPMMPMSAERPPSSSAAAYMPPIQSPPVGSTLPPPSAARPISRGASPYQPPPSVSTAAPSNRYAPAPGSQPSPLPGGMPAQRQVAPNPYLQQQQGYPQQQAYSPAPAPSTGFPQAVGSPPPAVGPPPQGPPRTQPAPPPPQGPPRSTPAAPPPQAQPPQPQAQARVKSPFPRGDRSHIPPSAQPIVDLLSPEVGRLKAVAPQQYKPQVDDMEKRINILFDHLNNQDLLSQETVAEVVEISQAVGAKDWEKASALFASMQTKLTERNGGGEGGVWVVGVKRLINMGKISK